MNGHNRITPTLKELRAPVITEINGKRVKLGLCCMCGRRLGRNHLNKTGVRCYYDGAQYDRDGKKLFDARSEKTYRAIQKLRRMFDGDSNDDEHDAAVELVDTIEEEGLLV